MEKAVPKQKKPRQLTYKQRAFIDEFVKTKNGTQSALKVYDAQEEYTASAIAVENLRKPLIKQEVDRRFQRVQELYQEQAHRAATVVTELMNGAENENVRLGAAKDIQDRAGHAPIQKSATISTKTLRIDL